MIIPFERPVDEQEFRRLLLEHFPEITEDIEGDVGLVHLQMGALERIANRCIKDGDLEYLEKIYEFASDLGRHQSEIVRFVERNRDEHAAT